MIQPTIYDPYVLAVEEFHKALYQGRQESLVNKSAALARTRLMLEELAESVCALHEENRVRLADGLGDLLYTCFGTALMFRIPIQQVYLAIHRSNMTKDFTAADTGLKAAKKGSQYRPPDIAKVLLEYS